MSRIPGLTLNKMTFALVTPTPNLYLLKNFRNLGVETKSRILGGHLIAPKTTSANAESASP